MKKNLESTPINTLVDFFTSPEALSNVQDFLAVIQIVQQSDAHHHNERSQMGINKLLELIDYQTRIIAGA